MEDTTAYPWASLPPAPQRPNQQPPDGAMEAFSATGASSDFDPMLWSGFEGNSSSSQAAEVSRDEPMSIEVDLSSDLLNEANDLLQTKYPNLDLSPSLSSPAIVDLSPNLDQSPDSWAPVGSLDALQFLETPPGETEYLQSHQKTVGMVGEGIVADVNGVVPVMEDGLLMCGDVPKSFDFIDVSAGVMWGDTPKTFTYTDASERKGVPVPSENTPKTISHVGASDGEATVPISARTEDQANVGTLKREPGVPECLNSAKVGSQASISASRVLQEPEVGVPMTGAKTGSQAFNYVGDSAYLETLGIPAAPLLVATPHTSPSSSMTVLNSSNDTLGLPNQDGTVDIDPKKSTVPPYNLRTVKTEPKETAVLNKGVSGPLYHLNSSHIAQIKTEKASVPEQITGTIKPSPQQLNTVQIVCKENLVPGKYVLKPGTLNIVPKEITVPGQTIGTAKYLPGTIGTKCIVPEEGVMIGKTEGTFNDCGTDVMSPHQNAASDGTSYDTCEMETCGNTKKKRRRRKKPAEGDGRTQKVPKYKLGQLDDALEERKRKDAIRAKSGREKNKQKMLELQENLQKAEEEKDELVKKNKMLADEVAGRRTWETTVLAMLREKCIFLAPYGTAAKGTQQMSPAQPLTISPGQPSR